MTHRPIDRYPDGLEIHNYQAFLDDLELWLRIPRSQPLGEDFVHILHSLKFVGANRSAECIEGILDIIDERFLLGPPFSKSRVQEALGAIICPELKDELCKAFKNEAPIELLKCKKNIKEPTPLFINQFYFQAPASQLEGANLKVSLICDVCDQMSYPCLELYKGWNGRIFLLPDSEKFKGSDLIRREDYRVCLNCLRSGKVKWIHNTGLGGTSPKCTEAMEKTYQGYSKQSLMEIAGTPGIATEQDPFWLTHCNDFMDYVGTWWPIDFDREAKKRLITPDELFSSMLNRDSHSEADADWDDYVQTCPVFYRFRCRHCDHCEGYFQYD